MTEAEFEPPKVSDVLRTHFLQLEGMTQDKLAVALGVSRHSVNELMNDRRTVTAPMALRLAHVLGTDPHFWMNLQVERDLYDAKRQIGEELDGLSPLLSDHKEDDVVKSFDDVFGSPAANVIR